MFNLFRNNTFDDRANLMPPDFIPVPSDGVITQGPGPVMNPGESKPSGQGPMNPGGKPPGQGPMNPGGPKPPGQGPMNPGGPKPPGQGPMNPGGPKPPGQGPMNPGGPKPPGQGSMNPGGPKPPGQGPMNPGGPKPPGQGPMNPGGPKPPGQGQNLENKIRPCVGKFTYLWLNNGSEFWFFVERITPNQLIGWRMKQGRKEYGRINLNRIVNFYCNR